jgi:hypothetical protein
MVKKIFQDTDFQDAKFANTEFEFRSDDSMPTLGEIFPPWTMLILAALLSTIFGVCYFLGSGSL